MEFKYENKNVVIKTNNDWSYDEVHCNKLKTLNTDLYNKLQTKVDYTIKNYDEIQKQEKEKLRVENIKLYNEKVDKFIEEHKQTLKLINYRYEIEKVSKDSTDWRLPNREIEIDVFDNVNNYRIGTITYDNKIYDKWGTKSRTNKCWLVSFNYKNTRYTSLENAISKLNIKIAEEIETQQKAKQKEQQEKFEEQQMEAFCIENKLRFDKVYNSSRYSNSYYTYQGVNDKTFFKLSYSTQEKKVVVNSITIKQPTEDDINNYLKEEM